MWRRTDSELPETGQLVTIYCRRFDDYVLPERYKGRGMDRGIGKAKLSEEGDLWWFLDGGGMDLPQVTHWSLEEETEKPELTDEEKEFLDSETRKHFNELWGALKDFPDDHPFVGMVAMKNWMKGKMMERN